jgi:predicted alpha/beta superfamily hydrolase
MKRIIIFFSLLLASPGFSQEVEDLVIGEVISFQSDILKEERTLNIYLPESYDQGNDNYPVIYLLDGSLDEDFIHIAGLTQFGSFPWVKLNPECIVVGIANVDRVRDFSFPTNNKEDREKYPTAGGSEVFISFLESEVLPMVEKKYRVSAPSSLIGQSMGGQLATEILFKSPNLFDNYIIVSPSLWWDEKSLLALEPEPLEGSKKIYITVGKEDKVMVEVANELYQKVREYKNEDSQVFYRYEGAFDHGNILHQATYAAFEKVFKEKQTELK